MNQVFIVFIFNYMRGILSKGYINENQSSSLQYFILVKPSYCILCVNSKLLMFAYMTSSTDKSEGRFGSEYTLAIPAAQEAEVQGF